MKQKLINLFGSRKRFEFSSYTDNSIIIFKKPKSFFIGVSKL